MARRNVAAGRVSFAIFGNRIRALQRAPQARRGGGKPDGAALVKELVAVPPAYARAGLGPREWRGRHREGRALWQPGKRDASLGAPFARPEASSDLGRPGVGPFRAERDMPPITAARPTRAPREIRRPQGAYRRCFPRCVSARGKAGGQKTVTRRPAPGRAME